MSAHCKALTFVFFFHCLQGRAGRGPIFEDGPGFESAFRLFHGQDGVVPLSRTTQVHSEIESFSEIPDLSFHPLSAPAAAISLSPFGPAGPFGFDGFMARHNRKKANKKQSKKEPQPEKEMKSEANTVSALSKASLIFMHIWNYWNTLLTSKVVDYCLITFLEQMQMFIRDGLRMFVVFDVKELDSVFTHSRVADKWFHSVIDRHHPMKRWEVNG